MLSFDFGDTVRVRDARVTQQAGLAGKSGIIAGLPQPSAGYAPELVTAWRDPMVRAAHVYELVIVSVVFLLMVTKPF